MASVTVPGPTPFCMYLDKVISRFSRFPSDDTLCHLIGFTEAVDSIVATRITSDPNLALLDVVAKVTEMEPVKLILKTACASTYFWD